MKKSNSSNQEDLELQQFFQELKTEEAKLAIPDLESMLQDSPKKEKVTSFWRYAAAVILLISGIGTYQWGFQRQDANADIMEIIISYEKSTPQANESEELAIPGMDQWQSETDILLSGL